MLEKSIKVVMVAMMIGLTIGSPSPQVMAATDPEASDVTRLAPGASWTIRAGANPSMDVALWYAPVKATTASRADRAIRASANPSMYVALWYAPGKATTAPSADRAIRAGANPSMNVALWYAPASADTENQLCKAGDLPCP